MNNETGMLKFAHDIQVGHRLYLQPGKCQQIHGHSMTVLLNLQVSFNEDGYAINDLGTMIEFGTAKKVFRGHLDEFYDHHLVLNENDPWAQPLHQTGYSKAPRQEDGHFTPMTLPGLRKVPGDPSTENIAKWIAEYMSNAFNCTVYVEVEETGTNAVIRHAHPRDRSKDKLDFLATVDNRCGPDCEHITDPTDNHPIVNNVLPEPERYYGSRGA